MADFRNCAVCRFMRGMAFGAIGAGVAGYTALAFGVERGNAILIAFFGALGLVMLVNRQVDDKNGDKRSGKQ